MKPYRRNIETIIDLAIRRNIKPVLTTQPHTVNEKLAHYYIYPHVDQCNAIARELRGVYGDAVIFVDLDSMMTGKMDEVFLDLGHMNDTGISFKAEQIGGAILQDFKETRQ